MTGDDTVVESGARTGDDVKTGGEPKTADRKAASARWTPRRTKLAGLGSLVGGVVGLGSLGLGAFAVAGTEVGVGGVGGAVRMLHPVVYVLFAVALLAADARYGSSYGRRGRIVAALLVLSLMSYVGTIVVLVVGRVAFGEVLFPVGALVGTAYLATRLFGTLYGIGLWRRADANRLTAGLFAALFPAIFVLGPLTIVGVPAVWIQSPLYLAFIALGYDLWTVETDGSRGDGGTEVSA